jgi:hypothetical protein
MMIPDDEPTEGNADVRLTWNPQAACRTLEGTAFILLNSRMMRLNPVGTRIWELFENGSTVAAVVACIVEEFDTTSEQAAADAHVFVSELLGKGLLIAVED